MGATTDNFHRISHDLRNSWWFRHWALLWLVGFILTLVALGVLGKKAEVAGSDLDYHVWFENATQLYFPRFHFRIPGDGFGITFTGKKCMHNGLSLSTVPCEEWEGQVPSLSTCFALPVENIYATNEWNAPETDPRIDCFLNTTGNPNNTEDALIALELEGPNHADGGNSYASVWIAPNDRAWVLLFNSKLTYHKRTYEEWFRKLVYHSTVSNPGMYHVEVILSSFFIRHVEQADSYTGWRALGDVGGFAFFMLLLQSMIMLIVGFCFKNDSKFLGGERD